MFKSKINISYQTLACFAIVVLLAGCGGEEGNSSDGNNSTTGDNGTASNGTTGATSNGTSSNGTTATSNNTTNTSNGTTRTSNGTTNGFVGVGLTVDSTEARSCELVLSDPTGVLEDIVFSDTVIGRALERGPRKALAFFRTGDDAIPTGAVSLQILEGADAASITVQVSRCFDRSGALLDAVEVKIAP